MLSGDVQWHAAGRQDLDAGAIGQNVGEPWRRCQQLFEIVDHQQAVAMPRGRPGARVVNRASNIQRLGKRHWHQGGIRHRREPQQMRSVLKSRTDGVGDFQRQAGLADTSRPRQGEKANLRQRQSFDDRRNLCLAANQWRHREGKRASRGAGGHRMGRSWNDLEGGRHRSSRIRRASRLVQADDTKFSAAAVSFPGMRLCRRLYGPVLALSLRGASTRGPPPFRYATLPASRRAVRDRRAYRTRIRRLQVSNAQSDAMLPASYGR